MDVSEPATRPSNILADWAQLARIPNTLTAVADILAGCGLALGARPDARQAIILCVASVAFYWAGMILNDVFDVDQDRAQGRKRPLVDGRISVSSARIVGWSLLLIGLLCCWLQGWLTGLPTSSWIALAFGVGLTLTILAYDSFLKPTWFGPPLMGMCRGFNLLLGTAIAGDASLYDPGQSPYVWVAVLGHVVYVTGFTIAARREAIDSLRQSLLAGWLISLGGLILLASVPWWAIGKRESNLQPETIYPILIALISYPLVKRAILSIRSPGPRTVQSSIKQAIMTIIALDAAIVAAFIDPTAGFLTLLLIVPSLLIGLKFQST